MNDTVQVKINIDSTNPVGTGIEIFEKTALIAMKNLDRQFNVETRALTWTAFLSAFAGALAADIGETLSVEAMTIALNSLKAVVALDAQVTH